MTIFQSIFLGIIQGLTEFLPISSSAHLVIFPYVLGWELDPQVSFVFNILVQVATLIAVIFYFKKEIIEIVRQVFIGLKKRSPFSNPDSKLGWAYLNRNHSSRFGRDIDKRLRGNGISEQSFCSNRFICKFDHSGNFRDHRKKNS